MSSQNKNTSPLGIDDIVGAEQSRLKKWHEKRGRTNSDWTGLALSGGGVRSATFCLGVLQALAKKDKLKQFDYLSTVSGGGFIGSAVHWWLADGHDEVSTGRVQGSRIGKFFQFLSGGDADNNSGTSQAVLGKFGVGPGDFPFGTEHPDLAARQKRSDFDDERQRQVLGFLRNYASYLIPGGGINIWSGIGVVLRAVLLNLLVWISLVSLTCYLLTSSWVNAIATCILNVLPGNSSPLPDVIIQPGWGNSAAELIANDYLLVLPPVFALLIWITYLSAAVFVLSCVFYSFQTSTTREIGQMSWNSGHTAWTIAGIIILVLSSVFLMWFWFANEPVWIAISASALIVALSILAKMVTILLGVQDMSHAYLLRRWFEKVVGLLFKPVLILLAVGLIPVAFKFAYSSTTSPGMTGIFAISVGVASALFGHYQSLRNIAPGLATKVMLPVGAFLFLFGVAVLGYEIAAVMRVNQMLGSDNETFAFAVESFIWTILVVGLLSSIVVDTNQIGLNRFYRDRLIETFMPRSSAVFSGLVGRSPVAERLRLGEIWDENSKGPYPLINTHVVLVNDADRKCRLRGGDNYLLSPLYCGSGATGWFQTSGEASRRLTLASAMATSGAAANPNAGYVGTGLTRNKLISLVMMLLNVRLGYWIANPNPQILKRLTLVTPRHLFPGGVYALLGRGWTRKSKYLELSDGGHFDNLGIYELVRRKCSLIVVCDGEADEKIAYHALVSVQRRIEEDFGATIVLTEGAGPELLVADQPMSYPGGAKMARQPYFLARIVYKDGSEADIIYMKSTMIDQLSFKVKGYKGSKPTFPHESTADQFFDPEQFEAYRELGYRTGMLMLDDAKIKKLLAPKSRSK